MQNNRNRVNPAQTALFFKTNYAQYSNCVYFFFMQFNKEKFFVKIKNKEQVLVYLDEIEKDTIVLYINLN
jgi:hypothetical protein